MAITAPLKKLALFSLVICTHYIMIAQSQLAPCPSSPNCFSTKEETSRKIKPLAFAGSLEESKSRLKELIAGMERTKLVEEQSAFLHFTFTTKIFEFVDDVTFECDEANRVIHFRSASRVGWSDIWANKRRMKRIYRRWIGE